MDYLALLKTLSFYSFYPIFLVLKFLGLLLFAVSAPFLRLAQYSIQVCMWPLRFLAKFEVRKYLVFTPTSVARLIVSADLIHLRRCWSPGRNHDRRHATLRFDLSYSIHGPREPAGGTAERQNDGLLSSWQEVQNPTEKQSPAYATSRHVAKG